MSFVRILSQTIGWIGAVFFLLLGLGSLKGSVLSGLLFFAGAVVCCPLVNRLWKRLGIHVKKRFLAPVLLVLFLAGILTANPEPSQQITTNDQPPTQSLSQESASQPVESELPASNTLDDTPVLESSESTEVTSTDIVSSEWLSEESADPSVEASLEVEQPQLTGEFSMHFIDVGQGDATLILCDGEAMLIDAGGFDYGTTVQLYLEKQGVRKLKMIAGTHSDADHIGGLDVILTKYDCEKVFLLDGDKDNKAYREVLDALAYKNMHPTIPDFGDSFTLGNAICTVLGPISKETDKRNSSIVWKVEYGKTSFLLSGDTEAAEECEIVSSGEDLRADVYHAGHHGSKTSSCDTWLKAICPEAIVISCGTDNPYGHPHAESLAAFRQIGAKVYRTDEQGSIVVTSDGEKLSWSCTPSDTWKAGNLLTEPEISQPEEESSEQPESVEPTESEPWEETTEGAEASSEETEPQVTYVLNKNTKKFHYPRCSSADDIKPKNRMEVTLTREEVLDMGYVPCKRCTP